MVATSSSWETKRIKRKTPLTKDEIYQMAKTIEASIKRRATEQ